MTSAKSKQTNGEFTTRSAMFGSGVRINTIQRSMVRIVCFVAVAGQMPKEAAWLRIVVVAIRHLQ